MKSNNYYNPANTSLKEPPIFGDLLKLLFGLLGKLFKTVFRRIIRGPRRKAWNWKLEIIIALQGVSYNLLSKIGAIRYQRVLTKFLTKIDGGGATVQISEEKDAPGHWFIPPTDNGNLILYFHGGGYVYGSVTTHGKMIGEIACATSARVLALDYRLAPEHPQPSAIEDACRAYQYLLKSGVPPNRIVLAGDSAGGGLVISTLLSLRDANEILPASGVCISPWVNLECSEKSFEMNASFDPVTREACLVAASAYLNGANPRTPLLSPIYASLHGLPPLLIHVGEVEVLHDQIVEFAEKAKSMGIDITLKVYDDMVHVWHMLSGFTPQAKKAITEIAEFIKTGTGIENNKSNKMVSQPKNKKRKSSH